MTVRPIIFSGPMVRALLDGRKTQTRRVFVPPAPYDMDDDIIQELAVESIKPRYGVGDLLWVKETWRTEARWDDCAPRMISGLAEHSRRPLISYEADYEATPNDGCRGKARPSIFMCQWMSRLTLRVTDAHVERLQAISVADARAEGLAAISKDGKLFKFGIPDRDGHPGNDDYGWHWKDWEVDPRDAYRTLWDRLNDARGYGWDANPWLVAISFEVIRQNVQALTEGGE